MAQQISRCNLSAAKHPLVSAYMGRSIIVPQHDMNYQRNAVFSGADQDKDIGVPQVFYMHNVMPTEQGYQSVGYEQVIAADAGGNVDYDQIITLVDPGGNKFLFVPAAGKNYVFDAPTLAWSAISSIPGLADNILVTSAYVQGESYVFYEKTGCFVYNKETKVFDEVTLIGLIAEQIVGITGSNGYLIAWDTQGFLYWSSATDPLDFTPSLITGAGSGAITDLKGRLVVILPTVNGFICYATGNAVGGTFTGNIRFPFSLKEIPGSAGVQNKEHISYEANLDKHYALTAAGLQAVTKTSSELLLPEVSDFLTSKVFEDFNYATNLWTVQYLSANLRYKLAVVGSRYFVISYGITELTHALVYDIAQKKWGKLKITHTDCFQFVQPNLYGEVTYAQLLALGTTYEDLLGTTYAQLSEAVATAEKPRKVFGFLQKDGSIQVVNFDAGGLDHAGVFLLGRFQFIRTRVLELHGFEVENVDANSTWEALVLPSYDGKNFAPVSVPYLYSDNGYLREYKSRVTGANVSLLFKGSFNLTSVLIRYSVGGDVRYAP